MGKSLTEQELHNLAMNIVGRDLESKGYEFIAINSKLKKHPQFVCTDKSNQQYFVIIQFVPVAKYPIPFDVIWMENFKQHARKMNSKVIFAQVGLGDPDKPEDYPKLDLPYLLKYEGLQLLDIEQN